MIACLFDSFNICSFNGSCCFFHHFCCFLQFLQVSFLNLHLAIASKFFWILRFSLVSIYPFCVLDLFFLDVESLNKFFVLYAACIELIVNSSTTALGLYAVWIVDIVHSVEILNIALFKCQNYKYTSMNIKTLFEKNDYFLM